MLWSPTSPRPRRTNHVVRKFYYNGTFEYKENGIGRVDARAGTGEFAVDFQNSDHANIKYNNFFEFLPRPVTLARGVVEPVGAYSYRSVRLLLITPPPPLEPGATRQLSLVHENVRGAQYFQ